MAHVLNGRSIAILATDGVERVEPEQPAGAVVAAGARTELLALHDGTIEARQADLEPAGRFTVDKPVSELRSTTTTDCCFRAER
jgi:protease I